MTVTNSPLRPFPEWRQLMERIEPLLGTQQQFTYDVLKELADIDIRTARGRQQFYKFRREALKRWKLWFENIPGHGYAVVPSNDQPFAAAKRVRQAKHKVAMARAINHFVNIEALTPPERLLQAQSAALLHDLSSVFNKVAKQFKVAASKIHLEISEASVKQIADAPGAKEKKV